MIRNRALKLSQHQIPNTLDYIHLSPAQDGADSSLLHTYTQHTMQRRKKKKKTTKSKEEQYLREIAAEESPRNRSEIIMPPPLPPNS